MANAAANAMAAKTKAMYAKRLTKNDYAILLQKKSVAEVASYLKNETYYASVLEGVNEKALHRGQLEVLIRKDIILRFSRILRYSTSKDDAIYQTIIVDSEVNTILSQIRSQIYDDFSAGLDGLPMTIQGGFCFDVKAVINARTYEDLCLALEGTVYHDILIKYHPTDVEELDFVGLEQELQRYKFEETIKVMDKHVKGKARKDVYEILYTSAELENIAKIYRLKKYFKAPAEKIKELITPVYLKFTKDEIDYMIDNVSPDHIFERIKATNYRKYLDDNFIFFEHSTRSINYNLNKRNIMYSSDADVVLLIYKALMDTEVQNIIDIIEGIRYRIAPDQINKILIY